MKKIASLVSVFIILFLINLNTVSAHVTISPKEAGLASIQNFVVSVPNEKDIPTTQLRLVLPEGVENVTPSVKPDWEIELKKSDDKVTEIVWKNGKIPADLRDEFIFRSKVPSSATKLVWKAYQTYEDGTEVSWDLNPDSEEAKNDDEESNKGPYSTTDIIDDLSDNQDISQKTLFERLKDESKNNFIADAALIIAIIALILGLKKSM